MKKEKWKRLKQNSKYLISSWGRVFSIRREKILRPYIHKSCDNKYLRVEIAGEKFMLHVLVAYHFRYKEMIELQKLHPNEKLDVDHGDRNTLNPNENNLRWVTHSDNLKHFHETNSLIFNGKKYKFKKEPRRY